MDRELRAVDSENKKNLQSDMWRLSQLAKSLANPNHPYHHFSTGNLQTLRDDPEKRGVKIREEFIKFYEKHYSANQMKLVVLGREPLDELETWVSHLFSEVKNKDLPENRWDDVQPLSEDDLSTQVFAKPVMESRSLELFFPFQDEEDMYETQPSRYVSHLIGHEGPGSILAYLKEKGWANSFSAGAYPVCPGSAFFEIEIRLTPDGLKRYQEVVKTVFQYISLMRDNPPLQWMFDEQKNMGEVEFKFMQKSPASRFTSRLSGVMQKPLPRELLLSGTSKLRRFDPKAIVQAMQFLRDDNFRLMIVDQNFPGDWNQKEQWYGTDYKVEKIPTDFSSEIRKALASSAAERPEALHLPHKNEFIPTRLTVERKEIEEPAKAPKLIRNDDAMRLWWKKDDTFWVPKANVNIILRNQLTYATPGNYVRSILFCHLVTDALSDYSYDAEISGLAYNLHPTMLGLEASVIGYNDKMPVLLEKVLVSMRDLKVDPKRFEIIKERLSRTYKNNDYQQPYHQLGDFTRWLTSEKSWVYHQLAAELPNIEAGDMQSFFPQLLSQAHIEVLAHGNVYKEDVLKMTDLIESTLKPRPLPPSQWQLRRNVILPPGSNYIYRRILKDPANVNHAIEYYLFVGDNTDKKLRAMLQLFGQITEEPAFDQLRTKEQLGYIVFSGTRTFATTMGYRVLIQSERHPPYLEERIDAFLDKVMLDLDEMSEEDFEGHRRSLINKRLEKLKNLEQESSRLWAYIGGERFNFYQIDEDVAELRTLTKADIQNFYTQYIDPSSQSRAKLSIQMVAQASPPEEITLTPEQKKEHLVEALGQWLGAQGVNFDPITFNDQLANVDVNGGDEQGILHAIKSYIEPALSSGKVVSIMKEGQQALGDLLISLKIKEPVVEHGTDGVHKDKKKSEPVLIQDVHAWKAGLKVSEAPRAVVDLCEFEEVGSKL